MKTILILMIFFSLLLLAYNREETLLLLLLPMANRISFFVKIFIYNFTLKVKFI